MVDTVAFARLAELSVYGDAKFCFHRASVGVSFEVLHDINRAQFIYFAFAPGVSL